MKSLLLTCLLTLLTATINAEHPALKRLKYGPDWIYQSIVINGEEVFHSPCESGGGEVVELRYEALKPILSTFDRPFTVLDLGANNGYFSLRILRDFDAVCVVVDGTERLSDICSLNTETNRLIHLQKYFTKHDLQALAAREHFDVVLALNVLHHVDDWSAWVQKLFQLGDEVIIETPSENDPINRFAQTKELARYLTSLPEGSLIGQFPRHDDLDYMLWFSHKRVGANRLGILPSTFLDLSGAFPKRSYVDELNQKYGRDQWVLQGVDFSTSS